MPAYNAAKTIASVAARIPEGVIDEVIVVDDASGDGTKVVARNAGLFTIKHKKNKGYGGNQKTCYKLALAHGADIVVMLHPDGQYDPEDLLKFISPLKNEEADAVFGCRVKKGTQALQDGMPWWKVIANVVLTKIANLLTGKSFGEWHCGYRAYTRKALENSPLHIFDNGFAFDIQLALHLIKNGFRIVETPVATKYGAESSNIRFWPSVRYGLFFLGALVKHKLQQ